MLGCAFPRPPPPQRYSPMTEESVFAWRYCHPTPPPLHRRSWSRRPPTSTRTPGPQKNISESSTFGAVQQQSSYGDVLQWLPRLANDLYFLSYKSKRCGCQKTYRLMGTCVYNLLNNSRANNYVISRPCPIEKCASDGTCAEVAQFLILTLLLPRAPLFRW